MPELPEVETIRRDLAEADLINRVFDRPTVHWQRSIIASEDLDFAEALTGRRIATIQRHGKWLEIELDRGALWIHLRMSGKLILENAPTPCAPARRVSFHIDQRVIHLVDVRKFARIHLIESPEVKPTSLGLDLLSLDVKCPHVATNLCECLGQSRRSIKGALLDQSLLAGLGNIYVDETLWSAELHPMLPCWKLEKPQILGAIEYAQRILKRAIACGGTTLITSWLGFRSACGKMGTYQHHLQVYGRVHQPCPRCQCPIERMLVAQRSTHYCPRCQQIPRSS